MTRSLTTLLSVSAFLLGCEASPKVESYDKEINKVEESSLRSICQVIEGEVCIPRIFNLLSFPERFHERKIEISGYAIWGERGLVVYPTLDMACSQTISSGIELDYDVEIPQQFTDRLEAIGVISISVVGRFKADVNGLSGRYVGHLNDPVIQHYQLPKALLKVNPQALGLRKEAGSSTSIVLPSASCEMTGL